MSKEKLNKHNYKRLLKERRGNNFVFLEDYKNSSTPILCRCNICNHTWKVAPSSLITKNTNCPQCSKKKQSKNKSHDLNYYKEKLIEHYGYEPYTFLSEYKGANKNIKAKCNKCHNIVYISPTHIINNINLNREPMCKYCAKKIMSKKKYITKQVIQERLDKKFGKDNSYTIIGHYKDYNTKTKIRCNICGYEWNVSISNLLNTKNNKRYCPSCNKLKRSDLPYEEKLKKVNKNIIPLEHYINNKTKILHKCLKCNYEWKAIPSNLLKGTGCPNCLKKINISQSEKEIKSFIESFNINCELDTRNILDSKKELDIYLPDLKIAFEIDGIHWHSEKYKDKHYHLDKTLECESKGIRLIHIFDVEWHNQKEIVMSKIKNILNQDYDLPKVYARKCYIEEIDTKTKNNFLDYNHIQGSDKSSIKLGLWYPQDNGEDILVSVMTFCKPRKSLGLDKDTCNIDYELSRFASDINYHVIGAFGKLFNYFKEHYKWNTIITYADRRWSQGNVYIKNGWKLDHYSKPNYWYMDNNCNELYHSYKFRKQNLKNLFPDIYDDKLSEREIMKKAKYKRIYDCGVIVFIYTKN